MSVSGLEGARSRDVFAGVICVLIGVGALLEARGYTIGSLGRLGPGFYPAILGALLTLTGLLIVGGALTGVASGDDAGEDLAARPDWRGWSCIAAGVVLFIALAATVGLAPAIFGCAFVSALGDRTATLRGSLILATIMCIAGTTLFGVLLGINMPLWQWPVAP